MKQPATAKYSKGNTLKLWVTPLLTFQLLIVLAAVLGNGMHPLLFFIQFIVWIIVGIILFAKGSALRRFAVGLLGGVFFIVVLSVIGFYANAEVAPGEFSHNPLEVNDLSFGSALLSSVTDPAVFIAALFGYECLSLFVECSNGLYYFAVGLIEAIFATGVIAGWLWARQKKDTVA